MILPQQLASSKWLNVQKKAGGKKFKVSEKCMSSWKHHAHTILYHSVLHVNYEITDMFLFTSQLKKTKPSAMLKFL